jgi:hypothetical protein
MSSFSRVQVCDILSDIFSYCIATAQALTIKKGLFGGTSKAVLSKLAVDVWNKYTSIENVFKALPGYKDANPSWKAFLSVLQGLSKGN